MLLKLHYSTFLLFILFTFSLQGQDGITLESFSSYEPGEQERSQLTFCLSSNGPSFSGTLNSRNLDLSLGAAYSRFKNSEKSQTWINASVQTMAEINFSGGLENLSQNGIWLNASILKRNYLSKKFFYESNVGLNHGRSYESGGAIQVYAGLGLGLGRVNNLNDIQSAQNLISKLKEKSVLQTEVSDTDVMALASYLAQVKNNRKFVNRGDISLELPALKSKLSEMGLLSHDDDIDNIILNGFQFEPLVDRLNGTTLRLKTQGAFNYNFYDSRFFNFNGDSDFYRSASLVLDHQKYINEKLQFNASASLNYINIDRLEPEIDPIYGKNYELGILNASVGLDYFKDNSQRFSVSLNAAYSKTFEPNVNPFFDRSGYRVGLHLEYEKRFSRNLSGIFGLDIGYQDNFGVSVAPSFKLKF